MNFRMIIGSLVLIASFACAKEKSTPEPPRGGLRVTVQGADPAIVQKIIVHLVPVREGGSEYEVALDRRLEKGSWETLIEDVLVDAYVVTARGYDAYNADPATTEPTLVSHPVQVIIPVNDIANLFLVMSDEYYGEDPPQLPYFVAVLLSKERIEQWETLHIDVFGGGGAPPLELSGRSPLDEFTMNRGVFSEPQELVYQEEEEIGHAELTWTPPQSEGLRTLILRLTDEKLNAVELGVQVLVGKNVGSLDFEVRFHLAPDLELRTKTENHDDGLSLHAWVKVLDDLTRELPFERTYEWEHSGCGGIFLQPGSPEAGLFVEDSPAAPGEMYFLYFIEDDERPEAGSCELRFTITEWNEVEEDLEEGVSREFSFELDTEQLIPITP